MKYKLILALIFIAFTAKAHLPAKGQPQLMIARQVICSETFPVNSVELKIENIGFNNDSTLEAELIRLSKLWMDAMLKHDSSLLNELMAPEYRLQGWDRRVVVYRATWLDNLYNYIMITHWEQSDIHAQVYGDVAIVTSLYAWTGTFHNNAFDSKGYLTDVWAQHNNRWQVVSRTNGTFEGSKNLYGK